jgi:hypothetical protein
VRQTYFASGISGFGHPARAYRRIEAEYRLTLPEVAAEALTIYRRTESRRGDRGPPTPSGGDLWHLAA